jgi:hypothetical protein
MIGRRYLAPTASGRDYTDRHWQSIDRDDDLGALEVVDDEYLERITDSATATHREFTMVRAAEHGIRAILRTEGPSSTATIKARVVKALGCDARTVERAAAGMTDLRRSGHRDTTRWALSDKPTPNSEGRGDTPVITPDADPGASLSAAAIREHVTIRMFGERQSPLATDPEIAAELLADHWHQAMGATYAFEEGDSTAPVGRPPVDRDWRPNRDQPLEPHQEVWRQGPGWRIAASPPDK